MRFIFVSGFVIAFLSPLITFAEGEPWQRVSDLQVGDPNIGVAIEVGDAATDRAQGPFYYTFDPEGMRLTPVPEVSYRALFSAAPKDPKKPAREWAEPLLRSGDGSDALKFDVAECEQGEEGGPACRKIAVTYRNSRFPLMIEKQCSYGCAPDQARIFDHYLAVGLYHQGEYEPYGFGFQIYDLTTKKLLISGNSPAGIYVTNFTPGRKNGEIWVSSNLGLQRVQIGSQGIKTYYFHEDFNPATGVAQFMASATPQDQNPFAQMARRFSFQDAKAYYEAVKTLPSGSGKAFLRSSYRDEFLPEAFNRLVPFLVKSAEILEPEREWGFYRTLGQFDDPRAVDTVIKRYLKNDESNAKYVVKEAFDRYAKLGKIQGETKKQVVTAFHLAIENELALIRAQKVWTPGGRRMDSKLISSKTLSLTALGDSSGFDVLNRFFSASSFIGLEGDLFRILADEFDREDGFLPTAVSALSGHGEIRACRYFDQKWTVRTDRANAGIAMALFRAIQNFRAKNPGVSLKDSNLQGCIRAFSSQFKVANVEKDFATASSSLSVDEKKAVEEYRKLGTATTD